MEHDTSRKGNQGIDELSTNMVYFDALDRLRRFMWVSTSTSLSLQPSAYRPTDEVECNF